MKQKKAEKDLRKTLRKIWKEKFEDSDQEMVPCSYCGHQFGVDTSSAAFFNHMTMFHADEIHAENDQSSEKLILPVVEELPDRNYREYSENHWRIYFRLKELGSKLQGLPIRTWYFSAIVTLTSTQKSYNLRFVRFSVILYPMRGNS